MLPIINEQGWDLVCSAVAAQRKCLPILNLSGHLMREFAIVEDAK